MRMRLSASEDVQCCHWQRGSAGFHALARSSDHAIFFGENVDIHHVFPQNWCKGQGIKPAVYDSIINKTPLAYRTNRIIGGVAPSEYLGRLEKGNESAPPITQEKLNSFLVTHLIDPTLLRSDDFEAFLADRQKRLLALIERALGKAAYGGPGAEEGEDVEYGIDDDATVTLAQ